MSIKLLNFDYMRLMKSLIYTSLPILFVLIAFTSIAQVNCEISIDTDIPVCRNATFELSVNDCDNCVYEWTKDGVVLESTSYALLESIEDQTLFTVKVTDEITGDECISESFLVTTRPEILIDIVQLQLTCTNGDSDNGNTAKLKASASGEFEPDEYHYFWDVRPIQIAPGDSTIALGLKGHLNYSITVKDNYGCFEKDTFKTKAYYNADIELFADPDTAYIQKPHIEFSFVNHSEDSIQLSNFFWDFNDDNDTANSYLPNPTHSFILTDQEIEDGGKDYMIFFTAVNPQGCDSLYVHQVKVIPMKLFIPNVFTPNGDGVNDVFRVTEPQSTNSGTGEGAFKAMDADGFFTVNHYYESTQLVVFNRQGRVIFRDDDYQNDWDGDNYSEGVYYYVLKATGPRGTDVYKGSVSIIRGGSY